MSAQWRSYPIHSGNIPHGPGVFLVADADGAVLIYQEAADVSRWPSTVSPEDWRLRGLSRAATLMVALEKDAGARECLRASLARVYGLGV